MRPDYRCTSHLKLSQCFLQEYQRFAPQQTDQEQSNFKARKTGAPKPQTDRSDGFEPSQEQWFSTRDLERSQGCSGAHLAENVS